MKVFLTGGGSGGHIFPNIALIEELKRRQREQPVALGYIGEIGGMEEKLIPPLGIQFFAIYSGKLRRYWSLQNFIDPFRIVYGFFQSLWILFREQPTVLFSKGGYVTLPVILAAWCCRIPVIIHESDTTPGLTNRLAAPFATTICVSWTSTMAAFAKATPVFTGIPIRREILSGSKDRGQELCGFENFSKPIILVIGGSLGAQTLNSFVEKHIMTLISDYNIIHITGTGKNIVVPEEAQGSYKGFEFVQDELPHLYAVSSLAFARAGATLLWEFAHLHLPALLVPLPSAGSRGDQIHNAEAYHTLAPELSHVIPQEQLTLERFQFGADLLKQTSSHKSTLELPNALQVITELLLS